MVGIVKKILVYQAQILNIIDVIQNSSTNDRCLAEPHLDNHAELFLEVEGEQRKYFFYLDEILIKIYTYIWRIKIF